MHKLSFIENGKEVVYKHERLYNRISSSSGIERIVACAPEFDDRLFISLISQSQEPFYILYVLHTPRGEGEPGRYQSPELFHSEIINFVEKYKKFFKVDSRFDIWVHSPDSESTIVWDRHDLIHCYGVLDQCEKVLKESSFPSGEPSINFVHAHHYHAEFDIQAKSLLDEFDWSYSFLKPNDVQNAIDIQ